MHPSSRDGLDEHSGICSDASVQVCLERGGNSSLLPCTCYFSRQTFGHIAVKFSLLKRMPWIPNQSKRLGGIGRSKEEDDDFWAAVLNKRLQIIVHCDAQNFIDLLDLAAGMVNPEQFLHSLPENRLQSLLADADFLKFEIPATAGIARRARNIDPRSTDESNIYKMPCILSRKLFRTGASVMTCVSNLGDVALSLRRPPIYVAKWFSYELGAQTIYPYASDSGRMTINGHHDQQVFELLLNKFIDKYVMCEKCVLPEIDLCVEEGTVTGKCKACGHKAGMDDAHKIQSFVMTHPPEVFAYPARVIDVSQDADMVIGKSLAGDEVFRIAGVPESHNVGNIRRRIAEALHVCPSNLYVFEEARQLCDMDSISRMRFCVKQEIPTGPPCPPTGLAKAWEEERQRRTSAISSSSSSTSSSSTSSSSSND